jgi:hypothetical protein
MIVENNHLHVYFARHRLQGLNKLNTVYMKANGISDKALDYYAKLGLTHSHSAMVRLRDDLATLANTMFKKFSKLGPFMIYFDNLNFRDQRGDMRNMTQPIVRKFGDPHVLHILN